MLHVLKQDSNIESMAEFQTCINLLLTKEIIVYPLKQQDTLETLPAFMEMNQHWISAGNSGFQLRHFQSKQDWKPYYYYL